MSHHVLLPCRFDLMNRDRLQHHGAGAAALSNSFIDAYERPPPTNPQIGHAPSMAAPAQRKAKPTEMISPLPKHFGRTRQRTYCVPAPWSSTAMSKRAPPH